MGPVDGVGWFSGDDVPYWGAVGPEADRCLPPFVRAEALEHTYFVGARERRRTMLAEERVGSQRKALVVDDE